MHQCTAPLAEPCIVRAPPVPPIRRALGSGPGPRARAQGQGPGGELNSFQCLWISTFLWPGGQFVKPLGGITFRLLWHAFSILGFRFSGARGRTGVSVLGLIQLCELRRNEEQIASWQTCNNKVWWRQLVCLCINFAPSAEGAHTVDGKCF